MLEGKGAVVTGGSRGIGRAIVQRLARDGATVVFCYRDNEQAATEVWQAVQAGGGRAFGVRADIGDADAVAELFIQAEKHLSGLDILINNAAAEFPPTPLADLADEDFDRVMMINTRSVFLALRHAARHMRDGGRIINISTINTVWPSPGIAAYAASKGAVEQLTAVAAWELGGRGITVNTVSPGATDTDLLRSTNPPGVLERAAQLSPLGRVGEPSDIADVVAFLASPDGGWITGQNIRAGGGIR